MELAGLGRGKLIILSRGMQLVLRTCPETRAAVELFHSTC
jgi:hypothetical protein